MWKIHFDIVLLELSWKHTLTPKMLRSPGLMASAQHVYGTADPNTTWIGPLLLTWGEDALPLCTPSVYVNSPGGGRSIPGYVLCMVSPLHARAFNLKMQGAANTQHPQKCPHRYRKVWLLSGLSNSYTFANLI